MTRLPEHDPGSVESLKLKIFLLVYVIVVHGTMFFWDIHRPNAFLSADRGLERMAKIAELRLVATQSKSLNGTQGAAAMAMTGHDLHGVELRVVDLNDNDVPRDGSTMGQIAARSDARRPEESAEQPLGGWFHTGDMATINEDGAILVVDHRKDIIANRTGSTSSITTFLATHGLVGDYLPQALLYLLGGRYLVILAQVILMIGAVMAVYGITHLFTLAPKASLAASLLYVNLPHSLVYPHMLASEAIFNPLVVISFYLTAIFLWNNRNRRALFASAALMGGATLVRPITILWPLVVFIALLVARISCRQALLYPLIALLPLLLWMGYIRLNTGILSMGGSTHDPGHNLYDRVTKIIDRLPERDRARARAAFLHDTFDRETMSNEHAMTLFDYFRFGLTYPAGCLRFTGEDIAIYVAKSGIEKLTIDYLDLAPDIQEMANKPYDWRSQLYSNGIGSTLRVMLGEHPVLILASLIGSLLAVALWLVAGLGALYSLKDTAYTLQQRTFIAMLGVFPLYVLAVSLWTGGLQTRHRAPAEFALSILAVLGWMELRQRISLQILSRRALVQGRCVPKRIDESVQMDPRKFDVKGYCC